MMGPEGFEQAERPGIIPRIIQDIFNQIQQAQLRYQFLIKCSYIEIYKEQIRDLLAPEHTNLHIRESSDRGIFIENVREIFCQTESQFYMILTVGNGNRAIASTIQNERSSRSHSVFTINVERIDEVKTMKQRSVFYLVDLAGSEKLSITGAEGRQLEEAKKINLSLSALGNVIMALTDSKSTHIPYRNSKLTRLIQESFGGNSKTSLITCMSTSSTCVSETSSTLKFGMFARHVKNTVRVNIELSPSEYKLLLSRSEKETAHLKLQLSLLANELKSLKKKRGEEVPQSLSILADTNNTLPPASNNPLGLTFSSNSGLPSSPTPVDEEVVMPSSFPPSPSLLIGGGGGGGGTDKGGEIYFSVSDVLFV
jgi:kinesin family protein 5